MKVYRNNGAIGAILDEYEKAMLELDELIAPITADELKTIVDTQTKDPDCKSIQTILTHLVRSGYGYVIVIRKQLGADIDYRQRKTLDDVVAYRSALKAMFEYNVQLFADYPNIALEEYDPAKKIRVNWGQLYDVDQLMEHAIMHILRHRRQIERFLIRMRGLDASPTAP